LPPRLSTPRRGPHRRPGPPGRARTAAADAARALRR
jgi:hypothetical protein